MAKQFEIPDHFKEKYNFGQVLGEGDFGCVRACSDIKSGQKYALKIVKKNNVMNYILPTHEIDILKKLDHPNIIKLHHNEVTASHYYLFLEFVEGFTLVDSMKTLKTFSEKQTNKMMVELLSGIDYLHSNNIMHRDINLQNVMIEYKNGVIGRLKIVDFGAACGVIDVQTPFVGTPGFGAPEMRNRNSFNIISPYTKAVDIYAAGMILQFFTFPYINKPAFLESVRLCLGNVNPQWEEVFDDWSDATEILTFLIARMTEMDPKKRYTAKECLDNSWMKKFL